MTDELTLRIWQEAAGRIGIDPGNPAESDMAELSGIPEIREGVRRAVSETRRSIYSMLPVVPTPDELEHSIERDQKTLASGIKIRSVFPLVAQGDPEAINYAARISRDGAEIRSGTTCSLRYWIFDRRVAITMAPLGGASGQHVGVVMHSKAVVPGLVRQFELCWRASIDLAHGAHDLGPMSKKEMQVLHLVSLGLKDTSIASKLGVSESNIERTTRRLRTRYRLDSRAELLSLGRMQGWDQLPTSPNQER